MENLPSPDPTQESSAAFGPVSVTTTGPAARPRSRRSAFFSGSAILVLAALVAVGGVTFAVGRLTAPSAAAATGRGNGTGTGGNGFNFGSGARPSGAPGAGRQGGLGGLFGAGGGLTIHGTVSSVTADTLTLTLASGATLEIPLQASTTYHDQTAGTMSDVQTGRQVLVELSGANGGGAGNGGASASANPGGSLRVGPAQDVTVVSP